MKTEEAEEEVRYQGLVYIPVDGIVERVVFATIPFKPKPGTPSESEGCGGREADRPAPSK
jgi:hypothetical protein